MKMIIDRFEGPLVVLEYEGKMYHLPKTLVPKGAREGDVVVLEARVDEEETQRRRERIRKLMDALFED
ncbi:MAG TPA: DUF3006 domain-containing protein [Clostridia bacterium]|nr:DUF3006 domain-containing protein [Clostridia bacterium]